jgi:hypothetical protein
MIRRLRLRESNPVNGVSMLLSARVTCLIVLLSSPLLSQTTSPSTYLKSATVTQTAGKVQIKAVSPRPIAQVLDALRDKYGWLVNYEDPQYTSEKDLVEGPGPTGMTKYPSGSVFNFDFSANAPEEEKVLRQAVDAYNKTDNPGRFELRKDADGHFHVVGTAARDDKGTIAKQAVLLDLTVKVPAEELSVTDTLNQVCEELSAESHVQVAIGISPRSLLDHNKVKLSGSKASARDLLEQSLQATHRNLYWRLIYDPSSKGYFLDIHSARPS